jgi:hypothetical protein
MSDDAPDGRNLEACRDYLRLLGRAWKWTRRRARELGGDVETWLKWAEWQATKLLSAPDAAAAVDAIATELRLFGRLTYREARDVWQGGRGVAVVGGRVSGRP